MELAIKNKWISFSGASTVTDLNGNDVLKVKGKVFTFSHKKFVTTLDDEKLYIVRNKVFSLFGRKAFVMTPEKEKLVTVRRKIFSLHDRYFVESSLGEMEIMGNIFTFDYKITLNGKEIGHISRRISLRDSFVLTIDDQFDYRLFTAIVIAIDNITDRRQNSTR